jgi:hypothetical protein
MWGDCMQALADHGDERRGMLPGRRDSEIPCALHRIAALRFASVRRACPLHVLPWPCLLLLSCNLHSALSLIS